ncbi:MAG: DMT family transporter [Bacillota bacterium]|nr:DMT family transporter [Bacillota bacterium]
MLGLIFSVIAGAAMSIQGVWNTRLQEKMGMWETTAFVQGTGFIVSIIIAFIFGNGGFKEIGEANKLYLLGGILGIVITFTVMQGIDALGATYAISAILIAQLTVAASIDAFGLFGTEKIPFGIFKIIGIALMIGGVIVFKLK